MRLRSTVIGLSIVALGACGGTPTSAPSETPSNAPQAPAAQHVPPATPPIDNDQLAAKLADPAALEHITAVVIDDDSCFAESNTAEFAKKMPEGGSVTTGAGEDEAHIDDASVEGFSRLHAWLGSMRMPTGRKL